jgi:outer membrane protein OmpA-like peptidoglycan-associated protein
VPLSRLEKAGGYGEWRAKERSLEGLYTRLIYLVPEGRSALEVLRGYQEELVGAGGSLLYECMNSECGGDLFGNRLGGTLSMTLALYPMQRAVDKFGSNGWCATTSKLSEQRYSVFETAKDGTLFSILTYTQNGSGGCREFAGRTFAMVQIVERKAREQKMVTVSAQEMRTSLDKSGRIALYGIYFDSDQAAVKPDSQPMLEEIAKLLRESPKLSVLIVGHTDNQGSFDYNIGLSERRARAVIEVLQTKYGISPTRLRPAGAGMIAPTATNDTEDGRARNRRVELVKL